MKQLLNKTFIVLRITTTITLLFNTYRAYQYKKMYKEEAVQIQNPSCWYCLWHKPVKAPTDILPQDKELWYLANIVFNQERKYIEAAFKRDEDECIILCPDEKKDGLFLRTPAAYALAKKLSYDDDHHINDRNRNLVTEWYNSKCEAHEIFIDVNKSPKSDDKLIYIFFYRK